MPTLNDIINEPLVITNDTNAGFANPIYRVQGVEKPVKLIELLQHVSTQATAAPDIVPEIDIATSDLSAAAQAKGLTVSLPLKMRVTNNRLLHIYGQLNLGASPQTAADVFDLFVPTFFTSKGIDLVNVTGNGGFLFTPVGAPAGRFLPSGTLTIIGTPAGSTTINWVISVD